MLGTITVQFAQEMLATKNQGPFMKPATPEH